MNSCIQQQLSSPDDVMAVMWAEKKVLFPLYNVKLINLLMKINCKLHGGEILNKNHIYRTYLYIHFLYL